jgi:signal transduction histidine kinase
VAELVARLSERELTPVERSEQEDLLADALDERGVDGAGDLAAALADAGVDEEWLAELAEAVPADTLAPAVEWVAADLGGRALLGEVGRAAARVSSLIDAPKDYTLLDRASDQDVDVVDGIEATLRVLAPRLGPGVEVVRDYEPELPPVPARAAELNQVWTNLIQNAADALSGSGLLHLRTGRDGDRIVVEVVDDGPGIPADVLARIWDPFFTTKGVGQATGLGLDVTRRVVAAHGGDIQVDSRPGRTRFTIRLPLKPKRRDR